MQYKDRIYGSFDIVEPVLLALMDTEALGRLKGVLQHGITGLLGITSRTTRFEHSVGVMLLVRRLGGTLEEQIAALLHDVSHTALSHVVDFMSMVGGGESLHEQVKFEYLERSDVPGVLRRFGYRWQDFVDEARFSLLERPAPSLCADRLDYFLRDALDLGLLSVGEVRFLLESVVTHEGAIALSNVEAARLSAYKYIEADDKSWSNLREVGLYSAAAYAIEAAIEAGVVRKEDLWGTDEVFWSKVKASDDRNVRKWLECVSPEASFVLDDGDPSFLVEPKVRTIDPAVVMEGEARPLSDIDREFARFVREYEGRKSGKWPVKAICGS